MKYQENETKSFEQRKFELKELRNLNTAQPHSEEWKSQIKTHEQNYKELHFNREKEFVKNFSDNKK